MRTKERGAIDEDAKSRQKSPKVANEQMMKVGSGQLREGCVVFFLG